MHKFFFQRFPIHNPSVVFSFIQILSYALPLYTGLILGQMSWGLFEKILYLCIKYSYYILFLIVVIESTKVNILTIFNNIYICKTDLWNVFIFKIQS